MRDAAERIRRESKSPVVERLKWKCSIVTNPTDPGNAQASYLTLARRENAPRLSIVKGITKENDSVLIEYVEEGRIVMADVKKKELLRVDGVDVSEVKHNGVLDLSVDGDRWEGDVLNDEPCGWGVLYDKDNHKVYEGFRLGGVGVCYGRSYYSDIERIEYEGGICDDMRWGRGVRYDRKGNRLASDEWIMNTPLDEFVMMSGSSELFHTRLEELVINYGSGGGAEWNTLDLSLMKSLRALVVGSYCFENVSEVRLVGLSELERVVIEENSFTKTIDWSGCFYCYRFCLKSCPKLKSLKIGINSFRDYTVCEIENVDALEVIEIGDLNERSYIFTYASLELKSILIHSE